MNGQLDNGFTPISNEILEYITKADLNGTQYKILLIIWRLTYGWNRKSCYLSNSYLSQAIDITPRNVQREITRLLQSRIITELKRPIGTTPRIVKFNENYQEWMEYSSGKLMESPPVSISSIRCNLMTPPPLETTDLTPSDMVDSSTNKENKENKDKYNNMSISIHDIFDYYQKLDLVKHRSFTTEMKRAIEYAMKNNQYDIEYCKTLLDRHKAVVEMTKDSEYQVKPRSLQEFFGQKVFNAKHLICSEYDEGGKYYEKYLKGDREEKIDISSFEMVYVDG